MTVVTILSGISEFMIQALIHSWPYLLLTIPLSVIVHVSGFSRYIGSAFRGRPMISILLATAAGAFSPFCSCGVIPVISALLISGVPIAPVMSFWLASPSMDPEIFLLSVNQLGWDLAVWRLAATFVMSLGSGMITALLVKRGWIRGNIMKIRDKSAGEGCAACESTSGRIACCADGTVLPESELNSTDSTSVVEWTKGQPNDSLLLRIYRESRNALWMVFRFMMLAFFLEAVITLYLPDGLISGILGRSSLLSIPAAVLISVPLYTSNLTALGLVAGLLNQGMSGGAALAFLLGGATTTIPAMAAVFGLVQKRIFILYLVLTTVSAFLTGVLYQLYSTFF